MDEARAEGSQRKYDAGVPFLTYIDSVLDQAPEAFSSHSESTYLDAQAYTLVCLEVYTLLEAWVKGSSIISQSPNQVCVLTTKPLWWSHKNGPGSSLVPLQHSKKSHLFTYFLQAPQLSWNPRKQECGGNGVGLV